MALTPKLQEGLTCAFNAPGVTLSRTRAGFIDSSRGAQATAITVRTANALVELGIGVYDDDFIPRTFTLTPEGIAQGRAALAVAA